MFVLCMLQSVRRLEQNNKKKIENFSLVYTRRVLFHKCKQFIIEQKRNNHNLHLCQWAVGVEKFEKTELNTYSFE